MNRSSFVSIALFSGAVFFVGCTENTKTAAADGAVSVTSSKDACELSTAEASSGKVAFNVTNAGDQVTEFYLLAADKLRIIGEVENIGPGLSRRLIVTAKPGTYNAACKPGMVGKGILSTFTVVDSGEEVAAGELDDELAAATTQYTSYVREQTNQLVTETIVFAKHFASGDDDAARLAYAPTRMFWERIEPVAESFGDLDPKLDLREADLEPGQAWTGWHRIEKDLWPPTDSAYTAVTPAERKQLTDQLVADTVELQKRVSVIKLTPDQLGNGAKELLDEVATGKVTGEEEIWSGTDLWDFQANVDGARIAFEVLEPVVLVKDKALAETLTKRFADVQKLLDTHRKGDGFVTYKSLSKDDVKKLADSVNALGEPLSGLTAAALS
jgi:iron uptake system component EfeO